MTDELLVKNSTVENKNVHRLLVRLRTTISFCIYDLKILAR